MSLIRLSTLFWMSIALSISGCGIISEQTIDTRNELPSSLEDTVVKKKVECVGVTEGETQSRTRFASDAVSFGEECVSEIQKRSCNKGILSDWTGTFESENCKVGAPKKCGELSHAGSQERIRFAKGNVAWNETCQSEAQTQTCVNGTLGAWSGTFAAATCSIATALDCGSIKHNNNEDRLRYEASSVAFGQTCKKETQSRKCTNGVLSSWSGTYAQTNCQVAGPPSCGSVSSGSDESRIRYASKTVPYYQTCQKETQTRRCTVGNFSSWSGTFTETSCSVLPAASCGNVSSGTTESRIRYASDTVAYNQTCASETQTRTCTNGNFSSWSGTFPKSSCSVATARSCGSHAHGETFTETRYKKYIVLSTSGDKCESKVVSRTCTDGSLNTLTGEYLQDTCIYKYDCNEGTSCTADVPNSTQATCVTDKFVTQNGRVVESQDYCAVKQCKAGFVPAGYECLPENDTYKLVILGDGKSRCKSGYWRADATNLNWNSARNCDCDNMADNVFIGCTWYFKKGHTVKIDTSPGSLIRPNGFNSYRAAEFDHAECGNLGSSNLQNITTNRWDLKMDANKSCIALYRLK